MEVVFTAKSAAGKPSENLLKGLSHFISGLAIGERLKKVYDDTNDKSKKLDPNETISIKTARSGNRFGWGTGIRMVKREDSISEANLEKRKNEQFIKKIR